MRRRVNVFPIVRDIMKNHNIRYWEVAERLGVTRQAVNRYREEGMPPDTGTLQRWAAVLEELLEERREGYMAMLEWAKRALRQLNEDKRWVLAVQGKKARREEVAPSDEATEQGYGVWREEEEEGLLETSRRE